jgi:PPOX class probable FMN-dependent enzyme
VVESKTAPDNRFTRAHGQPGERSVAKVKDYLPDEVKEFIALAPFAVMASSDGDGRCDASPKGGKPGFVKVVDDRRILVPDVAGNRLFQSYQNMNQNPHVGLVFFIPGRDDTVRVNGRVSIVTQEELERMQVELSVKFTDDNSKLLQGILVEVEEAYTHCPRAFKFSGLWDVDEIGRSRESQRRR